MSNKVSVLSIELSRLEGKIEECGKVHKVNSYAEANKLLSKWSHTAPATGGYDKCSFKIVFEDSETYEGRYDLKHFSCEQEEGKTISLKERVGSYCRFVAGYDRPSWMNDTQWAQSRASHKAHEVEYRDFLNKYDV